MATRAKDLVHKALQANKDHQYALKVYTERLEAELATVDKLLLAADVDEQEDEPEIEVGGFVLIPGSVKPVGPVPYGSLISRDSPFYEDASRRQRYLELSATHPMKAKELDALAEAVRTENYRIHAYEAHRRGQQALSSLNDQPQSYFEQNKEGIDWDRVATKVSSSNTSSVQRTPKECEIRWLGDRHPEINHGTWAQAEISQVRSLAASYAPGQVDWVKVAKDLGTNRTPIDCMRHATNRKAHLWDPDSDKRLLEAVKIYGIENWPQVARFVSEDATAQQCQNRYNRTLDPSIKLGVSWTEEEDRLLRLAVEAYGNSWVEVASCIAGRNNEQCRERWNARANPSLSKARWTEEEDQTLLDAVGRLGEGRWKDVSGAVGNGRNDKMCRGRYDTLKKGKQKERSVTVASTPEASTSLDETPNQEAPPPRPRPRPRARKAQLGVPSVDGDSVEARSKSPIPQPARPKPRARKQPVAAVTADVVEAPLHPGEVTETPTPVPSQPKRPTKRTKRAAPEETEAPPPAKKRRTRKASTKGIIDEAENDDGAAGSMSVADDSGPGPSTALADEGEASLVGGSGETTTVAPPVSPENLAGSTVGLQDPLAHQPPLSEQRTSLTEQPSHGHSQSSDPVLGDRETSITAAAEPGGEAEPQRENTAKGKRGRVPPEPSRRQPSRLASRKSNA